MSLQKINIRNSVLILMIIGAAATRLFSMNQTLTAWTNFTPVGAIAMFGGAYFTDKWKAYMVPLVTLLISDLILDRFYIGTYTLYSGAWLVYACFALMVMVGNYVKHVNVINVLLASFAALAIHWLVTDLPWVHEPSLYPKTLTGYAESLAAALPFEKNMLYGNVIYSAILFGGFELAKSKFSVLRSNKELAV